MELNLLIRFFDVQIDLKKSFNMKIKELLCEKTISESLYNDLNLINQSRNKFVKSNNVDNDKEIRNLLNHIKSLEWSISKRNKYDVYRLFLICMQSVHIKLVNSPNHKKYFKAIGIKL